MNTDNNERLAALWIPYVTQIVGLGSIVWKHEPHGDWFISHMLGGANI